MKSQIDFINEIAALHSANPEYEIHFFVRGDETTEFAYTAQLITKVEVAYWYPDGETIMTDEDEIREQLGYEISEDKSLSENEINNMVDNAFASVPLSIIAYTHAA